MENETSKTEQPCTLHGVKPRFYSFDEDEEDFESEVAYQECMCCGNIQQNGISCNKCSGPLRDGFL